jgi:RNA polymerase sigma factor (sigma-70 family)
MRDMMNSKTMETANPSDVDLVTQSLAGSREAFAQIVGRYQSLICSLTYSATGSLTQSEDLAQETFLAAWKQLAGLREPEKLRNWLCVISRNLAYDALTRQRREPSHAAASLDSAHESPAPEPLPAEQAMSREEQEILWRSIERIPEIYREPLVLFYREHQSVEAVARNLELTEDAVKQRLSRGRKLLHEQVLAFVEGALERTNPGKAFTIAVLAALPALTISAKAATIGATAVKGSATAKAAGAMGLFGAILSPVLGFFGMWVGYRMSQDTAKSDREREFNKGFYKRLVACIGGFFVIYFILMFCGGSLVKTRAPLFAGLVIGLALAYVAAMAAFSIWCYRARRKLLVELTAAEIATKPRTPVWEFRSRLQWLGLPFIHIRIGDRLAEPLKAWIAIGDCAVGVIFAFGGLSIAPISIGGCAIGLFSFGGLSIGALALGGFGLGVWTFGGLAIGWQSFGGCAIAWNAAWGGYAIAHDFALGGIAHAVQTNSDVVEHLLKSNPFFRISEMTLPYLFWLNLIWVVPMIVQWRVIARKRRQQTQIKS